MNAQINRKTSVQDLGRIDYKEAWDYQTRLFNETLEVKSANRNIPAEKQQITSNHLLFCQHPHVFTLGKSGKQENLLVDEKGLHEIQATYYHINRGGDITYHGPGQLVVYPIIDLENFFTDIHHYMRLLEESVIRTCSTYGVLAGRIQGLTGVWVDFENEKQARKICAMGVKTSRWVTMHGLAFNVNPDLSYFGHIVPCGIQDKAVTSLSKELGSDVSVAEVKARLQKTLIELFEMEQV